MHILKAAALYFLLVFSAGFMLGIVRQLWAVPRFGVLLAELGEQPFMLVAIVMASRFVVRRSSVPPTSVRLGIGLLALALLILAELTVVLRLRGLSLAEYISGREPVAFAVYLAMLIVFAAAPVFVRRSEGRV